MNVFLFLLVFLVVLRIHGIEEKKEFKHAVSEAEYGILVNLVKGKFNTPVKERIRRPKICNYQILESNIEIYSGQFYANHVIL